MMDGAGSTDFFAIALQIHKAGGLDKAEQFYRAAIDADRRKAPAFNNLAMVYCQQKKFEAAMACARMAVTIDPSNPIYHAMLSQVFWGMGRYDECEQADRTALRLDPDFWHAHHHLGSLQYVHHRYAEAVAAYDRAIELNDNPGTRWDRSWALLANHEFDKGWAEYELRWTKLAKYPIWDAGIPEWRGEDLAGKTIIVHHEQGAGDTIMFVRYAMALKRLRHAERVIFAAPPPLFRLLHGAAGLDEIVPIEGPYPPADVHAPVMSCGRWLWHDFPISGEPYLDVPKADWFVPRSKVSVGVIWSASITQQPGSEKKSLPVTDLLSLALIPDVTLYGLQKGDGLDALHETGAHVLINDLSTRIMDFRDLGAVMRCMDLIVTVDTGPLHLAGALGVPTVALIPYECCWRWSIGTATLTDWYDSVTLRRQQGPSDWRDPLLAARADVTDLGRS